MPHLRRYPRSMTTQLRISQAAQLLGVSDDTVRRMVDAGRLPASRAGGRTTVAGADVAAIAREDGHAPQLGDPSSRSARNQFPGIVTRIVRDTVMAQVEVQAGPFRVVALISAEAVDELGLEVGSLAVAGVKATHVTIETP